MQVNYIPVYWHPYFQSLGYKKGLSQNAEDFYNEEISLPIFPLLSNRQIATVGLKLKALVATRGSD